MITKIRLIIFLMIVSFPVFSQELPYKGGLIWGGDDFNIEQSNVIYESKLFFGFFTKVELVSGKLYLRGGEIDSRSEYLFTEMEDSQNSVPFGKNSFGSNVYWVGSKDIDAYLYLEPSSSISIFKYTPGKSKEKIEEEKKEKESRNNYAAELKKWEEEKELAFERHKERIEEAGINVNLYPFYYNKPKPMYSSNFTIPTQEEKYYLDSKKSYELELSEAYYSDLKELYEKNKNKVLEDNVEISFFCLFILASVCISIIFFYKVTRHLSGIIRNRILSSKENRKKFGMAKIAEEEAIREVVRSSVIESSREDLMSIRKKIAEAIESGDEEKIEYLLKIAERMKKM